MNPTGVGRRATRVLASEAMQRLDERRQVTLIEVGQQQPTPTSKSDGSAMVN